MKVIILAGGLGTRLAEETTVKPKPMVEIGPWPIIWHIMSIYASHGFKSFLVACGYKGDMIKDYFANYTLRGSDLTVQLGSGVVTMNNVKAPDWQVELVDTGIASMTGGRVKRLARHIGHEPVMLTYGDGVGNVDIAALVAFHRRHGKLATLTAVRPPARFGGLELRGDDVLRFSEKPQIGEGWINGGFMVLQPEVLNYIEGDDTILERAPLERLAAEGQLAAFRHDGFWQPMDTIRDKLLLEQLWQSGKAPWKTWS
jgi:glucose-1-phosphate cytidylyltransferase